MNEVETQLYLAEMSSYFLLSQAMTAYYMQSSNIYA